MNQNIRRLYVRNGVGAGYLIDLLSLLPADAIIPQFAFDYNVGSTVFYVVHPSFSEIEEFCEVPVLQIEEERFRSLFGTVTSRPARLIDSITGKKFSAGEEEESP